MNTDRILYLVVLLFTQQMYPVFFFQACLTPVWLRITTSWETVSNASPRSKYIGFIAFPFLANSVVLQPNSPGNSQSRILVKVRKQPFVLAFPFCKYHFLSFQYSFIQQHVAGSVSSTPCNQWLHSCCKKESL